MTASASCAGPAYIGLLVPLILGFSYLPSAQGTTLAPKVRRCTVVPLLTALLRSVFLSFLVICKLSPAVLSNSLFPQCRYYASSLRIQQLAGLPTVIIHFSCAKLCKSIYVYTHKCIHIYTLTHIMLSVFLLS